VKTTFDAITERYQVRDAIAHKIGEIIRDFEFHEENTEEIRLKETLGVCYVLRGLEKTSQTDQETISKAIAVMDALYASLLLRKLESEVPSSFGIFVCVGPLVRTQKQTLQIAPHVCSQLQ